MRQALRRSPFDREIVRLAVPALGALAADPLVSLVDTAFVGRLGATPLAALAVAAAVFGVAFAVFNFLAYGTTPLVARKVGAGDLSGAGRVVVGALVVAALIGVGSAALLWLTASPVLAVMGAAGEVQSVAADYLRIRVAALPAVLLITVGHGAFRGYQDTRTPLVVTLGLDAVNLVLDPIFIFTLGLGVAGAAWATVIAQWLGAGWFLVLILVTRRRELGIGRDRPTRNELASLLGAGRALVVRTAALLTAITLSTAVAARLGTVPVAAHQVALQIWIFLALVVDALAIAGQAMIGKQLAVSPSEARLLADRLLVMGGAVGVGLGAVMAAGSQVVPAWFTDDAQVVAAVSSVYPFLVVMQPLNALVFVWDGIAIGASAFGFLAAAMVGSAVVAVGLMMVVLATGWGLAGVWWALVGLMLARLATLAWWHLRGPLGAAGRLRASRAG